LRLDGLVRRIEAFVADFHTKWQRSGKSPGMFDFDPGVFGGRSSKTWNPNAPPPPGAVLEVTQYLGYRHI